MLEPIVLSGLCADRFEKFSLLLPVQGSYFGEMTGSPCATLEICWTVWFDISGFRLVLL